MAKTGSKRTFIAINIPSDVKKGIVTKERKIEELFPEEFREGKLCRWTKEENLHITLCFLGNVPDRKLLDVIQAVKEATKATEPFVISFNKIVYGPLNKMPPRMIWLLTENLPLLKQLARNLQKELLGYGLHPDIKPFTSHITLARLRTWVWRQIEPEERPKIEEEFKANFAVNSVEVMESRLKRTGPEYITLEKIPLMTCS
mgnify:CR=1 FL=1